MLSPTGVILWGYDESVTGLTPSPLPPHQNRIEAIYLRFGAGCIWASV